MRTPRPLTPARVAAVVIFTTVMLSLRAQFDVSRGLMGDAPVPDTLWRMAGYFTILTNMLVAATMGAAALGLPVSARLAAGLVVWMGMTGLIYHALLSGLWAPHGMAWWADQGLHTAGPVLVLVWWGMFAPKGISLRDIPVWLAWPAAYGAYALIRGALTGFWAYPFLNADTAGWGTVAAGLAVMLAAFAAFGAGLVAAAKRLP
ncbi:MAG: Pr6Pr family membrane protein [Pseudomonadota bacterium]